MHLLRVITPSGGDAFFSFFQPFPIIFFPFLTLCIYSSGRKFLFTNYKVFGQKYRGLENIGTKLKWF